MFLQIAFNLFSPHLLPYGLFKGTHFIKVDCLFIYFAQEKWEEKFFQLIYVFKAFFVRVVKNCDEFYFLKLKNKLNFSSGILLLERL
jgi:hypothetical protein